MQDKENSSTNPDSAAVAAASAAGKATQSDFVRKIADKIKSSENILIALSKDPSVDEIAAAIGLALYLDGMGKHATAIYSGRTPDELSFLQPDDTFEKNTDSLQDFIIALNKEKADHLRYKLEGDFVKVFVTPYKTRLTEDDLSFSYGDYNVDFVIALNVPAAASLDGALREHGRIMHDASAVNITTGDAGKFGEIEWSNPVASSLCEMVTELVFALQGDDETPLEHDIATALLTGIVAATDRFSNNRTNSDTLSLASKLMSMGADQQLISSNVRGNDIMHNDDLSHEPDISELKKDKTKLEVDHGENDNGEPSLNPYANMNMANPALNPNLAGPNAMANNANPALNSLNPAAMMNPATQAAPALNNNTPDPATMVNGTNNVTPEDVIVQPIIPGMPNGTTNNPVNTNLAQAAPNNNPAVNVNTAPAAQAPVEQMQIPAPAANVPAPVNNETLQLPTTPAPAANNPTAASDAPAPTGGHNLMEAEPTAPMTRQFGNSIQPPAPKPKAEKNYAEMMAEALAETPAPAANAPATDAPTAPVNAAAPVDPSTLALPNMAPGAAPAAPIATPAPQAAPAMEPVVNPNEILPPPPAPAVNPDMMPPVLPPVQVTPPQQ